jgi:cytochrome c biogenesis protein CcmG, thiol:disulfide interchange protein DsbE
MRKVLPLLLAAALLTACSNDDVRGQKPQEDRLPDVTLVSLTGGEDVDLGELRGPVVVNLWAQWCKPCKRELPIYQEFFAAHGDTVGVLGVDWQDVQLDLARDLAKSSGLTFPLVVDDKPEIRANGLPKLILVDESGTVAHEEYVEITSLEQLKELVEEHLGVVL